MRHALTIAAAAAVLGAAVAVAPFAGTPAQAQQQQQQAAPSFSDEQLRSYAEAALKVHEIGTEYHPQIERAQSDQDADQLRAAANEAMIEAVRDQGLTVEEYNQIFTASQTDPEVRSAVEAHMRAVQ